MTLALGGVATAWWGCAAPSEQSTTESTTTTGTGGGGGGAGGTDNTGGIDTDGGTTIGEAGACVATGAAAERVPLDIIFLVDRSSSLSIAQSGKWPVVTDALKGFFNDPASLKIGVGLSYFPNFYPDPCALEGYKLLHVPIGALPGNTFNLINSMPADATGSPSGTPIHAALKGALFAATAYQDAHPKHKVIVVLTIDGDIHDTCQNTSLDALSNMAESARAYNGVLTYVIGMDGKDLDVQDLDQIAEAGGTETAYDITSDIHLFAEKIKEIRAASLGCEFEIPPVPNGKELDPDHVNFSYTPGGKGEPNLLLRADDLADCKGQPGWYYDNYAAPTKIILCPASCATVQADGDAEVEALFGCKSQVN